MRSRCAYCEHYTCTCRPEPKKSIQVTSAGGADGYSSPGNNPEARPSLSKQGPADTSSKGVDTKETQKDSEVTQTVTDFTLLLRVLKDRTELLEFHGCHTGDCPHDKQTECDASLAEYAAATLNSITVLFPSTAPTATHAGDMISNMSVSSAPAATQDVWDACIQEVESWQPLWSNSEPMKVSPLHIADRIRELRKRVGKVTRPGVELKQSRCTHCEGTTDTCPWCSPHG